MESAVIAAIAAIVGLVLGFFVRWGEFRREQRFIVYTEFLASFLGIADRGFHQPVNGSKEDPLHQFRIKALQARMVRTRHMNGLLAEAENLVETASAPGSYEPGHHVTAIELARRIADEARRDVSGFGLPF